MHIADVAHHSEVTIVSMSPALLLAEDEAVRLEVALRRVDAVHAAQTRYEELLMALQDAERDLAWKQAASDTARAIAEPDVDKLHERRVGDVLTTVGSNEEFTVLGIRTMTGPVEYLVIPYKHAGDAEGDGPRPEWRFAGNFRRP